MDMQKKHMTITGITLLLVISIISYMMYGTNNNQQNIEFRPDIQQDAQVKNNELMLSKSLNNMMNIPTQSEPSQNGTLTIENSKESDLSNQSGSITLKE